MLWALDQGMGKASEFPPAVQSVAALYLRGAVYLGAETGDEAYRVALSMAMSDASSTVWPG